MAVFQFTGTAASSDGVSIPFTGQFQTQSTQSAPVISSIVVSPSVGPPGTLFTITISASDADGDPLTYTCLVDGVAATTTAQSNVFRFQS